MAAPAIGRPSVGLHAGSMKADALRRYRGKTQRVENIGRSTGIRPIAPVCDRIIRDFERGVSLRSVAKIYEQRVEVLEGILRDRLRALESAMRRAGVVVAAVLSIFCGIDSYRAVVHEDGAELSRAFRGRRTKRRGLEDSALARELRVSTPAAA